MRRATVCALLACCCALGWAQQDATPLPTPAPETEAVLSFDATLSVLPDNSLQVREIITVRVLGEALQHGIRRELVARREQAALDLKILQVMRDGEPETYRVKRVTRGRRIYIGSERRPLRAGEHTYFLNYESGRQIVNRGGRDRLYWNVTGSDWKVPIEKVTARVELPGSVPRNKTFLAGYTGSDGAATDAFSAEIGDTGAADFRTTQSLKPGEGLIIEVDWPQGHIKTEWQARYLFLDHPGLLVGLIGLALLLVYGAACWVYAAREPAPAVIAPCATPPVSPAGIRYLRQMLADRKTFLAGVVGLAAEEFLQVREQDGDCVLVKTRSDFQSLPPEERQLAKTLFAASGQVSLNHDSGVEARSLRALSKFLRSRYARYFSRNERLNYAAWGISGVALCWSLVLELGPNLRDALITCLILLLCTAGCCGLLWQAWPASLREWLKKAPAEQKAAGVADSREKWTVAALAAALLVLFVLLGAYSTAGWTLLLVAIMAVNFVLYARMSAPTAQGQHLLDQVEGFRQYLAELRVANMDAAEKRRVFERYLGHALALDMEAAWAERFHQMLTTQVSEQGYAPPWYKGMNFQDFFLRPARPGAGAAEASIGA